jgi:hypothetical protein
MVLLCSFLKLQTNIGIFVRYWRQSEMDWTNNLQEEEVFIPRRVFLIPNHVTSRSSAWAIPTPVQEFIHSFNVKSQRRRNHRNGQTY